MRIGFFTAIDGWGGSERYIELLADAVRRGGHEPVVVGIGATELARRCERAGITFFAWKMSSISSGPASRNAAQATPQVRVPAMRPFLFWLRLLAGNIGEARRLAPVIRKLGLDVLSVNVHGYEMAGLAARWAKCPCLAIYHISPVRESYWMRRVLVRRSARAYDRIVCLSEFSRRSWASELGVSEPELTVVLNGNKLEPFLAIHRVARREALGPLRLVSVGRLHPMKGHSVALEAMALLRDSRIHLTIAGEGEQRAALESLVTARGLGGCVRLVGEIGNVAPLLAEADAFVLASISHEACPLVLPEAMAAGLPLITSDFGPLPEFNHDRVTGLVVSAGDPEALAGAFRHVADVPADAAAWGIAARRGSAAYSEERMVNAMLQIYREVGSVE